MGVISEFKAFADLSQQFLFFGRHRRQAWRGGFFNFHANLALHGVKVLTIERRPDGFDFVALEQLLAEHRPSLYLTTGVLHNPTGHSFSPGQAFRLLALRILEKPDR